MSKITTHDVAKAIYAETKNKSGEELHKSLNNSVEFLAKKNLLSKAPEILKQLERIQDVENGIVRVKVESGRPLAKKKEDEIIEMLKSRYKAKDVILELKEDKTLLGGIRIEGRDEVIDLSLKNKISQLQNYLLDYSEQL